MKTALGYLRISKDDEHSISLEYQRAEIERYCQKESLRLVGIEADEGISGKSLANRPGVLRILAAVDEKLVDCVVVFKSDRLSRDGAESIATEKLFIRRGVQYLSVTEGELTKDSVDDAFMRFIRAGLNERERSLVSLRTRTAMAAKKAKGERAGGAPRYGYRVVNRELVPDPKEQEAIRRMTELRDQGYSTREIVRALAVEGIRTRKGTLFNQTQVVRVLKAAA